MPQCHTCQHQPDVAAGAYRTVPWKKTPCARCEWTNNPHNHGHTFVSLDITDNVRLPLADQEPHQDHGAVLDKLARVVRLLLNMDPTTRNIVLWRLQHPREPLRIAARRERISVQAAHSRMKRARKTHPAIFTLIQIRERNAKEA